MTRGHDELANRLKRACRKPGSPKSFFRPYRTRRLVPLAFDVIDSVMEPERDFHFPRVYRQVQMPLKERNAFGEVLKRMVLPVWLSWLLGASTWP